MVIQSIAVLLLITFPILMTVENDPRKESAGLEPLKKLVIDVNSTLDDVKKNSEAQLISPFALETSWDVKGRTELIFTSGDLKLNIPHFDKPHINFDSTDKKFSAIRGYLEAYPKKHSWENIKERVENVISHIEKQGMVYINHPKFNKDLSHFRQDQTRTGDLGSMILGVWDYGNIRIHISINMIFPKESNMFRAVVLIQKIDNSWLMYE